MWYLVLASLTLGPGLALNGQEVDSTDPSAAGSSAGVGHTIRSGSDLQDFFARQSDRSAGIALDLLSTAFAGPAMAATELNLSVESEGSNSITVPPAAVVSYEVVGLLSDDANEGLALAGFNLVFDGGDMPPADTPAGTPTPGCDNPTANFTIPWGITNPDTPCPPSCGYGGTLIDGDLIQVGGAQNTINNTEAPFPVGPVLTGVGQPSGCGPVVLVTGTLQAPIVEGIYTLALTEPFANVIIEGETGETFWASAAAGVGTVANLTIEVSAGPTRGACCLDITEGPVSFDTCVEADQNYCHASGGTFRGVGTTCDDVDCDAARTSAAAIPTVSEWGLAVMTLLMLTAGTAVIRAERRPA